jgi:hypothetical protein
MIQTVMMFERHLPPDHQGWFQRRREHLGEDGWRTAVSRWPDLISRVRTEIDDDTDPAHPRAQQLLAEWEDLVTVFLGDDPGVRTAVVQGWRAVWDQHPAHLGESLHVASPAVREFVERARRARWGPTPTRLTPGAGSRHHPARTRPARWGRSTVSGRAGQRVGGQGCSTG